MVREVLEPVNVGYRFLTNNSGWAEVVEKESSMALFVKFDDTQHIQKVSLANVRKLLVADQSKSLKNTFVQKALGLYGDKYDYSNVLYKNRDTLVSLYCKEHNIYFTQAPRRHLMGQPGCPECSKRIRSKALSSTTDEFIKKSTAIHGGTYDYSLVDYDKNHIPVDIICKKHGVFKQKPVVHLLGCGCSKCDGERQSLEQTKPQEQWEREVTEVHNGKYDYSLVVYKKAVEPVDIICPVHGVFKQTPIAHLTGRGCHKCARSGFNPAKDGVVYVLEAHDCVKVGITNKEVEHRIKALNKDSSRSFIPVFTIRLSGVDCLSVEKHMHKLLGEDYERVSDRFVGHSECFIGVPPSVVISKLVEVVKERTIK